MPTKEIYGNQFFNNSYSFSTELQNNFTTPYANSFSNTYTPQAKTLTSQIESNYFQKNNTVYDGKEKKGPKHLRRLSE